MAGTNRTGRPLPGHSCRPGCRGWQPRRRQCRNSPMKQPPKSTDPIWQQLDRINQDVCEGAGHDQIDQNRQHTCPEQVGIRQDQRQRQCPSTETDFCRRRTPPIKPTAAGDSRETKDDGDFTGRRVLCVQCLPQQGLVMVCLIQYQRRHDKS